MRPPVTLSFRDRVSHMRKDVRYEYANIQETPRAMTRARLKGRGLLGVDRAAVVRACGET